MHRLLKRQIKKGLGEEYLEDEKLQNFFTLIGDYYVEKDKERILLENALVVNSAELTETNTQLQNMAFFDSLTGLTNRKLFEKELELTLKQIQRNKRNIAVLFFDVDHFKTINDTLGHDIGDELLITVSRTIESRIRSCDTLARWGGDEFVLLLDDLAHIDDCSIIAENIQKAFSEPFDIEGHIIKISFSIGINVYEDGQTALQMLKNADIAMYLSKEKGRDAYSFFTSDISKQILADQKLNESLIKAIDNKEFIVLYQPQVDIATGKITGAEALVRWIHPEHGFTMPFEFIPLAEEKGYIVEIGVQVLEQACIDMKMLLDSGYVLNNIAVNLSLKQIRHQGFVQSVQNILNSTSLNPSYLEFEVTETMIMKEYEHACSVLDTLRNLGITLSIDDFGTGYSSLSYLKRLPIQKIKIDKSFIDEIDRDENDVEITKAIIAMSHSLGLKVLAEGVEEESQLQILRQLKCESYQGYYCSKPVAIQEFKTLVQKQNT
ncbi:EAL domain-containing protein [Sulfurimonas aquatica]|uniref:EAL domain-containing protein n=1 Tax=Sulfurimonas aquatica TaxID=2672570 RepID=A0A975AY24_9BACT|nr:bifunctional diguanylate cyclase/phosphodiesterase [Sulfurimonas aquatica]QSZ40684.1 EAL domain-containing protein [Sulfurimonas aquatica]